MGWTRPAYTRKQVDKAGDVLVSATPNPDEFQHALEIVNNWRASHAYPLQSLKMTLIGRARRVDKTALVAQRTKRIPAISLKLYNNKHMKLSRMHDIGGCRSVMANTTLVEKLTQGYKDATTKNPRRGGIFVKLYDYIAEPKPDGYRGVHLVYKYHSDSRRFKVYDGLRIELQIRSRLQHAWATAVETVDFFTGQALKSNRGLDSWKRFFALSSCAFAMLEKRPLVPGVPSDLSQLKAELRACGGEMQMLGGFQAATEMIDRKDGYFFLLELDSEQKQVSVRSFQRGELQLAQEKYLQSEKSNKGRQSMQTVLVSVGSFASLKRAYPNFFLDISGFREHLNLWLSS